MGIFRNRKEALTNAEFLYFTEEVEELVCFLDHSINAIGPGQIVDDITHRNLKLPIISISAPLIRMEHTLA